MVVHVFNVGLSSWIFTDEILSESLMKYSHNVNVCCKHLYTILKIVFFSYNFKFVKIDFTI